MEASKVYFFLFKLNVYMVKNSPGLKSIIKIIVNYKNTKEFMAVV